MSEQEPNPASRVQLGQATDRFGQPVAQLDWRLTALDRESIRRGQDLVFSALDAAGIGLLTQPWGTEQPSASLGGGFHHIGTTRLSDSPRRGVVDRDCRVHGMANLSAVGTSAFSTAGYANPTLTVIALAARLAARLKDARAPKLADRAKH